MTLRTLDSLGSLAGKRVIVRCDLNVPLKNGVITDDGRVRASLATINALASQGARVILISHLGRPEGAPDEKYSLKPVSIRLSELLGSPVSFAADTIGEDAQRVVDAVGDGDVALLENLRFNEGETSKSEQERSAFAEQLARFGDAFVSDGFGVVHRKQASVFELASLLPSAAGLLIAAELDVLDRLTEKPQRPYTVVLGGSKVSDKLGVIGHLLPKVDTLLIGGGMLFTFLAAQGFRVGGACSKQTRSTRSRATWRRPKDWVYASCSPPTSSWRLTSAQMQSTRSPAQRRSRRLRSVKPDSDSTSARRPVAHSRPSSQSRKPCSGTARWACSSWHPSPRAPGPSPML